MKLLLSGQHCSKSSRPSMAGTNVTLRAVVNSQPKLNLSDFMPVLVSYKFDEDLI